MAVPKTAVLITLDIEFLRSLPSLRRIDTRWSTGTGVSKRAAVFWKEYDAKKGAAPK